MNQTAQWATAAIAAVDVLFGLVICVVMLQIKNSVNEALTKFRQECDSRYETKELAAERHNHVIERLNATQRARGSHGD